MQLLIENNEDDEVVFVKHLGMNVDRQIDIY